MKTIFFGADKKTAKNIQNVLYKRFSKKNINWITNKLYLKIANKNENIREKG